MGVGGAVSCGAGVWEFEGGVGELCGVSWLGVCAGVGMGDVGVVELGAVVACGEAMGMIFCVLCWFCERTWAQGTVFSNTLPDPLTKPSPTGYNGKQQSKPSKSRKQR